MQIWQKKLRSRAEMLVRLSFPLEKRGRRGVFLYRVKSGREDGSPQPSTSRQNYTSTRPSGVWKRGLKGLLASPCTIYSRQHAAVNQPAGRLERGREEEAAHRRCPGQQAAIPGHLLASGVGARARGSGSGLGLGLGARA